MKWACTLTSVVVQERICTTPPTVSFIAYLNTNTTHTCRFHNIGLLILFLYDVGDASLEFSKTVVYFKERGGKEYWWPEMAANVCFAVFTIQQ